jgi:predicted permease
MMSVGQRLENVLRDVRHGWRALCRAPGYTVVVILTLTLGIGASVAVFSVQRSVLWRPLPYPDADRIMTIAVDVGGVTNAGATHGEMLDLREQSQLVDHVSTVFGVDGHVNVNGGIERVAAGMATDDLLPLLDAAPIAFGRLPNGAQDDSASAMRVVISHELWRRKFNSDPSVVGRSAQINNKTMEIVGVLRPGLRVFLPPSTNTAEQIDIWFPANIGRSRQGREYEVLARLKPGVTLQQAQTELDMLAARMVGDNPQAYPRGPIHLRVVPLRDAITRDVRPMLTALAGAVGFVLLIACVNVANLTLARNKARETEIAVRKAVGAGTGRLARQLFTESLLLAAIAAVAGLIVGYFGLGVVTWLRPADLPRRSDISMDRTIVLVALGLSMLTSVAFGLLPALWQVSERRSPALNATRSQTASLGARRLQTALVVTEVAVSLIPLVAAGLMLRTFANLVNAPIGFDPSGLQTARISLNFFQFPDPRSRWVFHRDLFARIAQVPGVEKVTAANPLPFAPLQQTRRYGPAGDEVVPLALASVQTVMPGYLTLTQTNVREGRDFTEHDIDTERQVVIVDQRIARQLWSDGAVGKQLVMEFGRKRRAFEIVGVTSPVRTKQVSDDRTPQIFVPYHVFPGEMSLVVRTTLSSAALTQAVDRIVATLGTGRAVFNARPMADYVADSISETRFAMLVLVGFAGAALLLAGLGLYGTLSYLISQRMREFGVRIALGGSMHHIMAMVVREGLTMSTLGAGFGLLGSLAVTRTMRSLLYNVEPFDIVTLLAVAALVVLVATLAAMRPAWRASRVPPNLVLRSE